MKSFFIIFLIFVATNTNAAPVQETDYKSIAADLLNKVTSLKDNANKIQSDVDDLLSTIQQKADALDYGIPENAQIIKILESLQQYQSKRGIENCIKLKDDKVQILKQELEDLFLKQIIPQLNNNKLTINAIVQTLQSISDNIQEPNLEEEIKFCINNQEQCRLTNEYPGEVDHSEQSLNFLDSLTDSLVDNILKTAVYPILSDKINTEIYTPVTTCISKL